MRRAITAAILAGIFAATGACDYPGVERSASELDPGLVNRGKRGEQAGQQLEGLYNPPGAELPGEQGSTRPGGIHREQR
ncbi:MAG: hypothetical protein WBV82_06635 [Myxococcaceae bacterium]